MVSLPHCLVIPEIRPVSKTSFSLIAQLPELIYRCGEDEALIIQGKIVSDLLQHLRHWQGCIRMDGIHPLVLRELVAHWATFHPLPTVLVHQGGPRWQEVAPIYKKGRRSSWGSTGLSAWPLSLIRSGRTEQTILTAIPQKVRNNQEIRPKKHGLGKSTTLLWECDPSSG